MMNRIRLLSCALCCLCGISYAQDIDVQSLTYDSVSRSMMVEFPPDDGEQYEKILMYYSMRCKDGEVSTGSDRNKGCGEWDYSCNTYITDSSRVDSQMATHPQYIIGGLDEDRLAYLTDPTYDYYRSEIMRVSVQNTGSLELYDVGNGDQIVGITSHVAAQRIKSQYLFSVDELRAAGMTAGALSGLRFDVQSGQGYLGLLRIGIAHAEGVDALTGETMTADFQQVYFDHATIDAAEPGVVFYQDFTWNGTDPIIVQMTSEDADISSLSLLGESSSADHVLHAQADDNTILTSDAGDTQLQLGDFKYTGEQITISFWFKGSDNLPLNTSIIHGNDAVGNRQLNIHMPWGDGQMYFDCGYDEGFDRINKGAHIIDDIKSWNHWAFTKNATTGQMRILRNGESWHQGFSKRNLIDIDQLDILSGTDGSVPSWGQIDGLRIFDKALSNDEIQSTMSRTISTGHPLADRLLLDYDFDEIDMDVVFDQSSAGNHPQVNGIFRTKYQLARQLTNEANVGGPRPNMTFIRGAIQKTTTPVTVMDSIPATPYFVREYAIIDDAPQLIETNLVYRGEIGIIYDDLDQVVDFITLPSVGVYELADLEYYRKAPMKYEIMSFVTPYGIGIDFGLEGKTWVFDVTKFAPILRGSKRISLERGGQNQEEMDIRFEYHRGTPVRDIRDISQIWPVTSTNYQTLQAEGTYEPRTLQLDEASSEYEIHGVVTGHGQEGEFIPRQHYLDIDGSRAYQWQVWTECAENPIYPQGGTWIYDRAGWCPGAPSDMEVMPITPLTAATTAEVNYGVTTGSGDSRYIVNMQLVEWGPANFQTDAAVVDIIAPSAAEEYGRFNPICGHPRITIQNTGADILNSLKIYYRVGDDAEASIDWTGSLSFLETEEVELPKLPIDRLEETVAYTIRVDQPNGGIDEYADNNVMTTTVEPVDQLDDDFVITMRTNSAPQETSWKLLDPDGNIVESRPSNGLIARTTYRDSIFNLEGCYQLLIEDSDQDGISWWANNDGNGYVSISDEKNGSRQIATDFGAFIQYNFIAKGFVSTDNPPEEVADMRAYPNPTKDVIHIVSEDGAIGPVHVYAPDGRRYYQADTSGKQLSISVVDWPAGTYSIHTDRGVLRCIKM